MITAPRVAGLGRGTVIGFLVIVVVVTGAALLAGVRVAGALRVATFAAGWVGLAMGAMIRASLYADQIRDADQESRLAHRSMPPTR